MGYGDIPNCMTRAAATGGESPCQAVRPPTGRVSGSHPATPSSEGRVRGSNAEPQSSLLRPVSQLDTFPQPSPIFTLFSCRFLANEVEGTA